jgi:hypothetical protein
MVEADELGELLDLVSNPEDDDHVYAEMDLRRDCARTLANLSEEYAAVIVDVVGKVRRSGCWGGRGVCVWAYRCGVGGGDGGTGHGVALDSVGRDPEGSAASCPRDADPQ